jgi:dTDP-4-dehydrorhamnose 3,5-epimerase-like enzyme
MEPIFLKGHSYFDERGIVNFNNKVDLSSFKRFYTIQNSQYQEFRGWHGHEFESKLFVAVRGRIIIGAVRVEDWTDPPRTKTPLRFELEADNLDAVFVPGGYANGILSKEQGSIVLVFSSSTLEESKKDDFRIPKETWSIS